MISVVIPVYQDWQRLRLCLSALASQTLSPTLFEVIVVDNDDTPLPIDQRPPGVRYLHEPEGHSYSARNAGLRAATGDLLAFTDADCLPEPQWLEEGAREMERDPTLDVAGGAIQMYRERDTLAAWYDCKYGLRQTYFYERWKGYATANLFVRRTAFDRAGPFNADLESGGDIEFCWRARDVGCKIVFFPQAVVRHPARDTFGELVKQCKRTARGAVEYAFRRYRRTRVQAWRGALHAFRPQLTEWYHDLIRDRGTELVPRSKRLLVLSYRVMLHYVFAAALLRALTASMRKRGWP